jgi:hypothetical protein
MFAPAYSGFPVKLSGVGELHAAFLNESRTRGCWWGPAQEIRIHGRKKMGRSPISANLRLWLEWPAKRSASTFYQDRSGGGQVRQVHSLLTVKGELT